MALAGTAAAQSGAPAADDSLTWHGITLYGIVDIGLQYQTHGAPISDYFPGGSADVVQKDSNHSVVGATPSNMAQSRVGLQGVEPIIDDWSGVFKLETFFNPQSGQISDAEKSQVLNNGRALAVQTTNVDSSVDGQAFQQAYAGFSSKTYGTITFGRQNTLLADGIAKYDPNYGSQAFSLIGISGTTAGGGDTEDRRLDSSLKYVASYAGVGHFGAEYKFNNATGGANTAFEVDVGGEYAGLSVDVYYAKIKDAVATAVLSAAQTAAFTPPPPPAATATPAQLAAYNTAVTTATELAASGATVSNSLAATVSDNTSFAIMGLYNLGAPKLFAGYEHISYANPATPLPRGFDNVGGYKLAFVNNAAFPSNKVLQVFWAGLKYTVIPQLDLTGAFYGYKQNSYATSAEFAGCSGRQAGTCSGTEDVISFDVDYRLTKRFDAYAGVMYSGVHDGLANGYLHVTDTNTTVGVRFKF